MKKKSNPSEFWIYLQREYFSRFPDANNDDVKEFMIRFNKTEGTEKNIEALFEEEQKRREN
ncbi:hypothetical protein [Enterococcus faecalis]|uniref:hypothetical protein n=1 Tax=Enterococcus TaxID=1350 RepID=UPI001AD6925B|nr:hypothetical protein [Enterococcus faecalis]MBO6338639.1 hypothetical protein [Enterococcus faecalis]MBO6365075.1 hypothetical protein [Enterococcus faecalis]HDT8098837.1 hypothetical protein [Enterococcus faecalis]